VDGRDKPGHDDEDETPVIPEPQQSARRHMGKRMTPMNRTIAAAALVVCSLSPAFATTHYVMQYHDMVRPNGHKVSDAAFNAALNACYSQTGLSRNAAATQAFKDCMKAHNGFGAICVPPQGTVHYTNQHGLNCTRTGIMSVCGGF
jgi:hypothetical protein